MGGKIIRIFFSLMLLILAGIVYNVAVSLIEVTTPEIGTGLGIFTRIIQTIVIGAIAMIASNVLTSLVFVDAGIGKYFPERVVPIVSTLVKYGVWLTAANSLFTVWGVDATGPLGLVGLIAVSVGFGMSKAVQNAFGFARIIQSDMFRVGDTIIVGSSSSVKGRVTEIGMMETRLAAPEGGTVIVPNNVMAGGIVIISEQQVYDERQKPA